ncbi:hypothetical protein RFH54_04315 [Acinetobacter soli]|uniref:hypothetical protein n=1 Tax=Acinetobacter soli TaxID=487316 RepID=UPI00280C4DB0|nr:hypothetical protein [Acinetobacter soli]MDQ8995172.1 hypothetical protein [Acinetobacter soli]
MTTAILILIQILLVFLAVFALYKLKVIKKEHFLKYVMWYSLFSVVSIYANDMNVYLKQWADLWFIFAVSYFVIYEADINLPEVKS